MPHNWASSIALLAATLAVLASCAGPKPPATAHVQQPADPCRKYERPTDFGRCRLFTSADGWRFIPEIGRNADLDTQLRCAPFRPNLGAYTECIGRALAVTAAPAAGAAGRAPIRVESITPDAAVVRPGPAYSSGSRGGAGRGAQVSDAAALIPDGAEYGVRRYHRRATSQPGSLTSQPGTSSPDLFDCSDLAISSEAHRTFLAAGGPSTDPYDLDRDGDGFACEYDPRQEYRAPKQYHAPKQPTTVRGSNCHTVRGYYRKDGTYVRGHTRCG
jgi:hypothetical protein